MSCDSLLSMIPIELNQCIIQEWLGDDSMKDVCSLDIAITNRMLRESVYYDVLSKIAITGLKKKITLSSYLQSIELIRWKERRKISIKRLHFVKYAYRSASISLLGCYFSSLEELTVTESSINLHHILCANLVHLKKIKFDCCSLIIEELLMENVLIPSNVVELEMSEINDIYNGEVKDNSKVPLMNRRAVFLWIAKCCPMLETVSILLCVGADYGTVIYMLQNLPQLTKFIYNVDSEEGLVGDWATTIPLPKDVNYNSRLRELTLYEVTSTDKTSRCLVEILIHCCNPLILEELSLTIGHQSAGHEIRYQMLLRIFSQMKSLLICDIDPATNLDDLSDYITEIANSCKCIEELRISYYTINDIVCSSLLQDDKFMNLKKLTLNEVIISDENMEKICKSKLATQLTSLILYFTSLPTSFKTVISSFTCLLNFRLTLLSTNEDETNGYSEVYWTVCNALFNPETCSFAKSVTSMTIDISAPTYLSQSVDKGMIEEQVINNWIFAFPQLKTFSFKSDLNNALLSGILLKQILKNCPLLSSLSLMVLKIIPPIELKENQPEAMRRLRNVFLS